VAQQKLEQCSLLHIRHEGFAELAGDDALWQGARVIGTANARRRQLLVGATLDHVRSVLAIDAVPLPEAADVLARGARRLDDP
jgi:hypothetical protein